MTAPDFDEFGASSHNLVALKRAMTDLSLATEWPDVIKEWQLEFLEWGEDTTSCLCGVTIMERCHMRNLVTRKRCVIGNVCVRRFLGIDMRGVFRGLASIRKDVLAAAGTDLLVYAHAQHIIDDWQYQFAVNTLRKRKLSARQHVQREAINQIILKKLCRNATPDFLVDVMWDSP